MTLKNKIDYWIDLFLESLDGILLWQERNIPPPLDAIFNFVLLLLAILISVVFVIIRIPLALIFGILKRLKNLVVKLSQFLIRTK